MRSEAPTVDRYLGEQPADWQPMITRLRAECQANLSGYTESMAYGMPSYSRDGTVEVAFGKQARYLSLYVLKQSVFDAHRADLAGLNLGKGCIRYRHPDQVNWSVVSRLLSETRASGDQVC